MKKLADRMKITTQELEKLLANDDAVNAAAMALAQFNGTEPRDEEEKKLLSMMPRSPAKTKANALAIHRRKTADARR